MRRQQQHGHTEYAGDGGEHRQPGRALPVDTPGEEHHQQRLDRADHRRQPAG
ncbi:Uncharacterised protein [Klebsiella pneumoniae]|nr:Uncharacterised protein [Klebsiella pneumoniae]